MNVIKRDGSTEPYDPAKIERLNEFATKDLNVDRELLRSQIKFLVYDGMKTTEVFQAQMKAAAGLISAGHPEFTFVASRYLLAETYKRVTGAGGGDDYEVLPLRDVIEKGINGGRYSRAMLAFNFETLQQAIKPERDRQFDYFGLQNLVDRYLMRLNDDSIIELPQHFFMRVAMGMALNERQRRTERAVEFYHQLSQLDFLSSTPTLFNSGTVRSQLSSCYLNTVADQISVEDVEGDVGANRHASIFGTIEECAKLSKYAGGIGTSWTRVRGTGSLIKGTNGKSSGVIPYLKVYNDTAVAVNQGGKRKGSFAPYLEAWHPDFWDFCQLKKEFGDERLRAHDIFPAAWIADLLMKRIKSGGDWSIFCPHTYPELHELYGDAFEARYEQLEREGKATSSRPAIEVWKHILSHLFETGHPWVTFKDECNRRNPQNHVGVIHSSNLCTEITLNTSDTETAVCNLGSVNLAKHIKDGKIDFGKLRATIRTAMRMLDNVIDLNFYPSDRAKASNMRHRPVGLGMMGYVEAMVACGIDFESRDHLSWANELFEHFSYYTIDASMRLAQERGAYESFVGSKWHNGIFPMDTARPSPYEARLDWPHLKDLVDTYGMRNSNTMALAPTATISILANTTPVTEAPFELERWEKNISGAFKVVDPCLKHGRPDLVKTVWQIAPEWVVRAAAVRQRWIDQAQSTNIFVKQGTRGAELAEIYMQAWEQGLKTTYYLRGQSQTTAKKAPEPVAQTVAEPVDDVSAQLCSIENPNCESCQ